VRGAVAREEKQKRKRRRRAQHSTRSVELRALARSRRVVARYSHGGKEEAAEGLSGSLRLGTPNEDRGKREEDTVLVLCGAARAGALQLKALFTDSDYNQVPNATALVCEKGFTPCSPAVQRPS
jgi:hypothetical protein